RRSQEVKPGQILPIKAFGQDFILVRSPSGKVAFMEGHCAHRGASIGHGGDFVGECIRCPFHGFQYDLQGVCVKIPDVDRIPKAALLKTYPVAETLGMIWMFYGPEPTFPPPTLEGFGIDEEFGHLGRLGTAYAFRKIRQCLLRDAICGSLDYQHTNLVHKARARLEKLEEPTPYEIIVTLDVESLNKNPLAKWKIFRLGKRAIYRGHYWGPAIVYTRSWGRLKLLGHIRACLPINEERVQTDMLFIVKLRRLTGRPGPLKLAYRKYAGRQQDDNDEFIDYQKPRAMFIKNFDDGVLAHHRMCLRMGQTAHIGREPFLAEDKNEPSQSQRGGPNNGR
ncbi:Rieske (2Fe-2S) protein, partial [Candidatus Poribacteria bacterium]|nr:Rieske (2Fe-2S) protein [Candidatus Poribacteria bacterium]